MSTETEPAHDTKCVFENCPAYWTGLRWAYPDETSIPAPVLEHAHTTIGGEQYLLDDSAEDEAPQLCSGDPGPPKRSQRFHEAMIAAENYLEARRLYEQAYRHLVGHTCLVPEDEHAMLVREILQRFRDQGFTVPEARGLTFVDVSDLLR